MKHTKKAGLPKKHNGIHVEWSAPNQAYFVMWNDAVLSVITSKDDVRSYLRDLGARVSIPRGLVVKKRRPKKVKR